ncbi:glycosyltransferase family 4 protein [Metabacillus herbersteinensis]|uniref:Glycosyltransferase family 4 protein n=1 Tax=Metabacillus herbersteinensis TaxID=283816 RepID=A0ABV6G8J5_9BACI
MDIRHDFREASDELSLRILMLTTEYPPNIIGGLGRHVGDLSISLQELGHEVTVITLSTTQSESYEEVDGVRVYRVVPIQTTFSNLIEWNLNVNFRFIQFFQENFEDSFDIIHAHDWLTSLAGIGLKRKYCLPLIATIHATEKGRNQNNVGDASLTIVQMYEKQLVEAANKIIVCSHFMKEVLMEEFRPPLEKLAIIPNGVNELNFKNAQSKNKMRKKFPSLDKPFIFSLGRLVTEKGFQYLLRSMPGIMDVFPTIQLVIAGEGPELKNLQQMAKKLHIQNSTTFVGFVNDLERNALLQACTLTVVPSTYEPFGIVALESMISKKPTVVSRTGGLKEIITKDTGVLFKPGDEKELAQCIISLLKNVVRTQEFAEQGYKTAKSSFNWRPIAKSTSKIYEKFVKK